MVYTEEQLAETREVMKQQCVEFIESFANDYVNKWAKTTGDSAKAEGWAILQASAALRDASI